MTHSFLGLARLGRNHAWRYWLGALLTLFTFLQGGILTLNLFAIYLRRDGNPATGVRLPTEIAPGESPFVGVEATTLYVIHNLTFLFFFLGLALSLKLLHRRSLRTLITPAQQINWRRIGQGFSVFFALKVTEILTAYWMAPNHFTLAFRPRQFLFFLPFVFVLTPIQTTTEELFCRGYLLQAIGIKFNKQIAIISTAVIFTFLHVLNPEVLTQSCWSGAASLFSYYFMVGAFLAWLTLKDNTLELAIGVHAANNIATLLLVSSSNSAVPSPAVFNTDNMKASFSLTFYYAFWLFAFAFIIFRLLNRPNLQH